MEANKKLKTIVAELFKREQNISFVFMLQSYFAVPTTVRLNETLFYHEISNKKELQLKRTVSYKIKTSDSKIE